MVIVLKYNGYNTSAINTNLKYRRSVAAQLAWLACPGSAYLENALHHSNTARYLLVLYINLMLRDLILRELPIIETFSFVHHVNC